MESVETATNCLSGYNLTAVHETRQSKEIMMFVIIEFVLGE